MKTKLILLLISIWPLHLLTSCTIYESEAHKLINEKGQSEGGVITISSSSIHEETTCVLGEPTEPKIEVNEVSLVESSQSDISYWGFSDQKDHLRIYLADQNQSMNCNYKLHSDTYISEAEIDEVFSQTIIVFRAQNNQVGL